MHLCVHLENDSGFISQLKMEQNVYKIPHKNQLQPFSSFVQKMILLALCFIIKYQGIAHGIKIQRNGSATVKDKMYQATKE